MKILGTFAIGLLLAGCVEQTVEEPLPLPDGTEVSGTLTQSATWSGTVLIKGPTTIDTGSTITVAPGTTVLFAGSNSLTVKGTLDLQGTAAGKINLKPQTGTYFGGVSNSGTLKMAHVIQKGGGVFGQAGSITITDSQLSGVQGDLIVLSGGSFTASYSRFGVPSDTTHCELHFNGGTISISKSDIVGAPYGFMLYGSSGTYVDNNWHGNGINIDRSGTGSGTFTNNWFEGGKLMGFGGAYPAPTSAAAKLTGTGPRS